MKKNNVIPCGSARVLKDTNDLVPLGVEIDESRLVLSLEVEKDHRLKLSLSVGEVIRRNETGAFVYLDFETTFSVCEKILLKHGCKVSLSAEEKNKLLRSFTAGCSQKLTTIRANLKKTAKLAEHLNKPISFRIPFGWYEKVDSSVAAGNEELKEKVQQGIQREQVLEEKIGNLAKEVENLEEEVGQGKKRERVLEEENERLKEENENLREEIERLKLRIGELEGEVEKSKSLIVSILLENEKLLHEAGDQHRQEVEEVKKKLLDACRRFDLDRQQLREEIDKNKALDATHKLGLEARLLLEQEKSENLKAEIKSLQESCNPTQDEKRLTGMVGVFVSLKDDYGISDAAYHEIWMYYKLYGAIPPADKVKREREWLNYAFENDEVLKPKNTPDGKGYMISLSGVCIQLLEKKYRAGGIKVVDGWAEEIETLKPSGDGAAMFRKQPPLTTVSVGLVSDWESLTAKNLRRVVAVVGEEKYEQLAESCGEFFEELDAIYEQGYITINPEGEKIKVRIDVAVCTDYKFLLLLRGMNGANSAKACGWCLTAKKDYEDLGKPCVHRTLEMLREAKSADGHKYEPLLKNIPPHKFYLDGLHADLRVFDQLFDALVEEVKETSGSKASTGITPKLHKLEEAISQSCSGLSFKFYYSEASGKKLSHTSLTGGMMREILENLPGKLTTDILDSQASVDRMQSLWSKYWEVSQLLRIPELMSEEDIKRVEERMRVFCTQWVSLGQAGAVGRFGYGKLTPYMHCLLVHVPDQLRVLGCLAIVNCQAVELLNDDTRTHLMRTCAQRNSAQASLQVANRQQRPGQVKRVKRGYDRTMPTKWTAQKELQEKKKYTRPDQIIRAARVRVFTDYVHLVERFSVLPVHLPSQVSSDATAPGAH